MRILEEIVKVTDLNSLTDDELITLHEHIIHDHVGDHWECIYYFDDAMSPYKVLSYDAFDVLDEYNVRFNTYT